MATKRHTFVSGGLLVVAITCAVFAGTRDPRAQTRPEVRFVREHIRLEVRRDGVRVDGTYVFINDDPVPRTIPLFYPFPVDSLHPWPTSIRVYSQENDTLSFSRPRPDGILFRISLPERGHGTVQVVYEQPSLDGTACYILTTTSAWQRPLERAQFEVSVPSSLELDFIAYDVDNVVVRGDDSIYLFAREDFMPTKDLCVRWRVP